MSSRIDRLFLFFAIIGLLFVTAEFIVQFFGFSICQTEGCELVAKQVRFGEWIILLIGSITFLTLLVSHIKFKKNKKILWGQINLFTLIIALACEGFFTGYQAFRLFAPCYFCLIVFLLIVILGILKFLEGEKIVLAGFGAMAGVFLLLYLILPVNAADKVPDKPLILFYSNNCKHCREIMEELKFKKIDIPHVLVDDYSNFLKNVGIKYVPVLFINLPWEKRFIVGASQIREHLIKEDKKENIKEEKKKEKKAPSIKKKEDTLPSFLDLKLHNPILKFPDDACNEEIENCD